MYMKDCFLKRTKAIRYLAIFLVMALCIMSCIHVGGTATANQKAKAQDNQIRVRDYENDSLTLMLITDEPISDSEDGIQVEFALKIESVKKDPLPSQSSAVAPTTPKAPSIIDSTTIGESISMPEKNTDILQESITTTLETEESIAETTIAETNVIELETNSEEKELETNTEEPTEAVTEEETEEQEKTDAHEEPSENLDEEDTTEAEETEDSFEEDNEEPFEEDNEESPEKDNEEPEADEEDADKSSNEELVMSGITELAGAFYDNEFIPEDQIIDTYDLAPYCEYIEKYDYYRTRYTIDGLKDTTFTLSLTNLVGQYSYTIEPDAQNIEKGIATFTLRTDKPHTLNETEVMSFDPIDIKDMLGDKAYPYGIIADRVNVYVDVESNIATNLLEPNNQTIGTSAQKYTNVAGTMYIKELADSAGALQLHDVSVLYTGEKFIPDPSNSRNYTSVDEQKQIRNVGSNTVIMQSGNYVNVNNLLEDIGNTFQSYYQSETSDNVDTSTLGKDMNNSVIDTSKSTDNPAIVNLDISDLNYIQPGGLKINTAKNQTVILNVKGSGDFYINRYHINGISSATSDNEELAKTVIWNFSKNYSGDISLEGGVTGIFVAPNATVYNSSATGSGRIYAKSVSIIGGEWHFVCSDLDEPEIPEETEPETTTEETTSIEETTSMEETSPIEETSSMEETTSIEQTSSIEETTSTEETSSTEETTSIEETSSIEETTSTEETSPMEETSSPEETTSIEETTIPEEPSTEETLPEETTPEETLPGEPTTEKPTQPSYYPDDSDDPDEPDDPIAPNIPSQRTPTNVIRNNTPDNPVDTTMLISVDDDLIALNAAPDPLLISLDDDIPLGAPKTGDESNPILSLITLLSSSCILVLLLFKKKTSTLEDEK